MQKRLNLDYALIQSFYWMLYCPAGVFVSVFLLDKGYSNAEIGYVMAAGSIAAILLQALTANLADRALRITNITVIQILILISFLFIAMILMAGHKSWFLTIAYTAYIVAHTTMHPFVNAVSFTLEEGGHHVSYGLGRSMGSLAAGIICFVMGFLVSRFSPDIILQVSLINLILMGTTAIVTNQHYKQISALPAKTRQEKAEAETIRMSQFIRRNKVFVLMSLGVVGLFFGNVILENFTIQIVEGIGGDTEQMGLVIFLLSVFEMPAMLAFNRLKARFSYVFLLRIAAVFLTVKIVMMYLASSMAMVYLAQLNQILGYGLLFPAMVSFIDYIMEKGEALRGQAVFTAALTIGNVLGSVFGGMILDASTPKMLLLTGSIVSGVGTLLIVCLVSRITAK